MRLAFTLLATLLLAPAAMLHAADARKQMPNIVLILADDLGYGDVQCYNRERGKIATPQIDKLASQGMRFTDAHTSSGVCSPTRYALLTGRYHWRTRLQAGIVGTWERPLIAEDRLTLAGLCRSAGYRTHCVGKWHLGWDWPFPAGKAELAKAVGEKPSAEQLTAWQETFSQPIAGGPTTRGFDHYFGTDVPNWPPYCFIEDNRTVGLPTAFLPPALLKGHLASKQGPAIPGWELEKILPALTDRACRIIEEGARSEQPFFLYLPLTSPHTPLAVNKEWLGKSGLGTYADLVMETDAAVGRVLNAIEQSGEAERTLVIFTSDNGCAPYIGAAEMEKQGHFPSGPWRGYKSDAWEGGHRVPFIVRWPGVATAGSVCGQLVQQSDWMATLAEVLQKPLAANAGEDSFSLLPLLEGKDQPVREFAVSQSSQGLLAVRQGNWKLIVGQGSGGWSKGSDDHPGQLYDLAADPGETKNRWADDPQRVEQMKGLLEKLITPGRSTPGPAQANDVAVNWQRFLQPGAGNKKGAKKKAG